MRAWACPALVSSRTMTEGARLLALYLRVGAGIERTCAGEPADLLQRALDDAAGSARLDRPFGPRADDPCLLGRLRECAGTWRVAATGPEPIPPMETLEAFLEAETAHAFASLVRAVQERPRDREATAALLYASQPDLAQFARLMAATVPWMLTAGRNGTIEEALWDHLQGFCLYLLKEDAAVIRKYQGGTRGEWRTFLARVFRRYVVAEGRRARSARRGGRTSSISIDTAAGAAALEALLGQTAGPPPADARALLLEVASKLRSLRERDPGLRRDVDLFLRATVEGATFAEIASDRFARVDETDVRNAVRRVRRLLRGLLGEGGR